MNTTIVIIFVVLDIIATIGIVFFFLSRRNKSGGASHSPSDFNATSSESPFHSSTHAGNSHAHSSMSSDEIMDLLRRGQKLEAIKIYRERAHCGLKEAKDAVEELQRRM